MSTSESRLQLKARRRSRSLESRKQRAYWIFLIPFIAGFVLLFAGIYFDSLVYSFSEITMNGAKGFSQKWVGFANYNVAMFKDPDYMNNVKSAVLSMIPDVLMITFYSLFVAVLLNRDIKGRTAFRAIFFIPVILATGFMTKADMNNLVADSAWAGLGETAQASGTVANGLFDAMDIQEYLMNLSFSPALSGFVVSAVTGIFDIVNDSGVQMMIFLAGLQSISPSIYEAADIDGASGWETFWLVTFPMISPYILVNVFYTIVDSFTKSDNPIMTLVQQQSFKANAMGVGAAMAWLYFLIVLVCIGIILAIIRSYIYYQQRD